MTPHKDVLVGNGEIGEPLARILGVQNVLDAIPERCRGRPPKQADLLHVCIPYTEAFADSVVTYAGLVNPVAVVVHSTVEPHTTERVQSRLKCPVIYSPTHGVHARMESDMRKYTKAYSPFHQMVEDRYRAAGLKTECASSPLLLEYRKVLDTTYYGWLITFAQITQEICWREGLDYEELWRYAGEIHAALGNRPKMYPGVIGGHCVIPNAHLLRDPRLRWIIEQNEHFRKEREGKA